MWISARDAGGWMMGSGFSAPISLGYSPWRPQLWSRRKATVTHAFFTRPRSLLDVFSLGKKAPPFLLQSYFYFVLYGLAAEKPLPFSL